eukprot:3127311-Pyramimonas_sp.AAC.1
MDASVSLLGVPSPLPPLPPPPTIGGTVKGTRNSVIEGRYFLWQAGVDRPHAQHQQRRAPGGRLPQRAH